MNETHQAAESPSEEIIGVIPAAGIGSRLGRLPCSKEIYPIGFDSGREGRPKAVSHYLLEKMGRAGIRKAYIVLRAGKWDIPAYLQSGSLARMHLAYLVLDASESVPVTLDQAYPFIQQHLVALGFPDIYFESDDVYIELIERLKTTPCDAALGLFPSDRPEKTDMIDMDPNGRMRDIIIKPTKTNLRYTWGVAVWNPVFTEFMHRHVMKCKRSGGHSTELFVGDVIRTAIDEGLKVEAVHVSDQPYIDIGTPDDLSRAANLRTQLDKNPKKALVSY
jgi:glucose-1-phosphate thymidylyltransferase